MATLFVSAVVGADRNLIIGCVRSLLESAGSHDVEICVTFNETSADDEALIAELNRDPRVKTTVNAVPLGFATNHNRAILNASADYVLVANDDLLFRPDAVERCVDFLERDESIDVAALSPRLLNDDGTLQRSTYGFPTVARALLDLSGLRSLIPHNRVTDFIASRSFKGSGKSRFWAHDKTANVDTFRGAAMFARSSAWSKVGPFCELARVGGEVAEWHRRCHDLGWRVVFFPNAEVIHYGSRTVGRDALLRSEYIKGYLIFFNRHSSKANLVCFRGGGILVASVRLAISTLAADSVGMRLWSNSLRVLSSSDGWSA